MRLFELCAADRDIRFSPFVWRVLLALAHKGLAVERVPCRFLEKEPFAPSGSKTVPVLEDDGTWVADSWRIACYLEDRYPEAPSLFGGDRGRALCRFVTHWADRVVLSGLFPMIAADVCDCLEEPDRSYFRESREKRLGQDLYALRETREERLGPFRAALAPLRAQVSEQPFVSGQDPAYADYAIAGGFIWCRGASALEVLEPDDPVHAWRERMLDLFDGLARKAKRAH
ncbi:MAG: glutathione S-transferase family protein [Alphaproteobacteria bacterium]|nr:MAG: glutathione S-transferase family protein [Alphaproteobacteria bacterium]